MNSSLASKYHPESLDELRSALEAERLRATELEREREFARAMFEHSNDAVLIVSPEQDEIIDANERACKLLEYRRDELLATRLSAIHPSEMAKVLAFARSVRDSGHGQTDELTCMTKSGRVVTAEVTGCTLSAGGSAHILMHVRDVSKQTRLEDENAYLREAIDDRERYGDIVGRSAALRRVLDLAADVALTQASVLICGESGTGKELIAREIHKRSPRRDQPMVRVNCASIPSELFESEFFGHVRGAFSGAIRARTGRFELADGGTLFLDEVSEIPIHLQGKLLRVLQEGQFERVGESRTRSVDVRVIAATNRDLRQDCLEGRFRTDLFYRLSVFPVEVPPLRERREDVQMLTRHFLEEACARLGRSPVPEIDAATADALMAHDWPGNIRELRNVVERAVILAPRHGLRFDLGRMGRPTPAPASPASLRTESLTLADLKRLEREIIVRALEEAGGAVYGPEGAAARLDLRPTTLASKLKRLGISKPPRGSSS